MDHETIYQPLFLASASSSVGGVSARKGSCAVLYISGEWHDIGAVVMANCEPQVRAGDSDELR